MIIAARRKGQDMSELQVTTEELLAGAAMSFDVVVPENVLCPGDKGTSAVDSRPEESGPATVRLGPLTIGTFQLIMKAARDNSELVPLLMIKESLVEPALTLEQVRQMHLGLVNFLIAHIRQISGLTGKKA